MFREHSCVTIDPFVEFRFLRDCHLYVLIVGLTCTLDGPEAVLSSNKCRVQELTI
jgi:hypothetical protein